MIISACDGGNYFNLFLNILGSLYVHQLILCGSHIGHLALMLTRYLHDEKVLPLPLGLMLFSVKHSQSHCSKD